MGSSGRRCHGGHFTVQPGSSAQQQSGRLFWESLLCQLWGVCFGALSPFPSSLASGFDLSHGSLTPSWFHLQQSPPLCCRLLLYSMEGHTPHVQVRTRNFSPALNLGGCNAVRLRVKGDGLRYKLSIRTDSGWDGVGYTQYTPLFSQLPS